MPIYRFAEFLFDSDKLRLSRAGERLKAQPKVLGLLAFLLEHRDRLVSRNEMADSLWERAVVSEDAITKRIGLLRKLLGDTARERRFIHTSYSRGARFIGDVTTESETLTHATSLSPPEITEPYMSPSLIILPFRMIGQAAQHSQIATGLPDDITSALVKLRSIRVIARGTAFRYAKVDTPLAELREDLGVRYALGGSVEVIPDGLRIYAELLRTSDEGIVWSENYRVPASEIHSVRAEMVAQIVNRAEIAIPQEEAARTSLKMPSQLTVWEAYHRGLDLGVETTQPDFPRARIYLERAIADGSGFARAHAALSFVHWNIFNTGEDSQEDRDAMLAEAERAVALDRDDPMARVALGTMYGSLGDTSGGGIQIERALDLAPGMARAHAAQAGFCTARGELEQSLAAVDRAVALSPRDPHLARWLSIRLVNHIMLGQTEAVQRDARDIEATAAGHLTALGWALTGFSIAKDADAARRVRADLRKLLPKQTAAGIPKSYKSLPPMLQALLTKTFRDHGLMG